MGHAFAANLIEGGHQVLVYDRDPKRIAALTRAPALPRTSAILPPAMWW
jgi:3-hydroxyisobutyrate dehydrogenase-like beta-hydroxyacid dehydrogenase